MQKSVEIMSRGLVLRGMLHIPQESKNKVPIVLIFHGFTGNKMEPHFIFVKLSRALEARGIASVRFDFGGSGESDGEFIDMTISKELEDAKEILAFAKTLDFVDINRIGILGLSMGGAVASMLAGDCKDEIQSLCLWAPAGNMSELVTYGKSEEDIQAMRNEGYWDVGGLLVGTGFLDDVLSLDIFERASFYNKNVLLLHGDCDMTVPLSTSEKYLEVYGSRAVLHTVENGDHTFNSKYAEEEVLEYTVAFFEGEYGLK